MSPEPAGPVVVPGTDSLQPFAHRFAITVDDFDRVFAMARARGAFDTEAFGHHIYELPGGEGQLYLRDPAGNLVEVNCPSVVGAGPLVKAEIRKLADDRPERREPARPAFPGRRARKLRAEQELAGGSASLEVLVRGPRVLQGVSASDIHLEAPVGDPGQDLAGALLELLPGGRVVDQCRPGHE